MIESFKWRLDEWRREELKRILRSYHVNAVWPLVVSFSSCVFFLTRSLISRLCIPVHKTTNSPDSGPLHQRYVRKKNNWCGEEWITTFERIISTDLYLWPAASSKQQEVTPETSTNEIDSKQQKLATISLAKTLETLHDWSWWKDCSQHCALTKPSRRQFSTLSEDKRSYSAQ